MKSFVVFAVLFAAAMAVPITPDGEAVVLRYDSDNIGLGDFNWVYETSNGISMQEEGKLIPQGDEAVMNVRGAYSYPGPDGVVYTVTYVADENGFRPEGAHLPKA